MCTGTIQIAVRFLPTRLWSGTCLKLIWAAYLLLTSLYCLLTFLPYTYYALIKAPAYEWMPWFVHHHAQLYWLALLGAAAAYWPGGRHWGYAAIFGPLTLAGIVNSAHPVLVGLNSSFLAYVLSIAALAPVLLLSFFEILSAWPKEPGASGTSLRYSPVVFSAVTIALLCTLGTKIRHYTESRSAAVHLGSFELGLWSLITHVVLAIMIVSFLNLNFALAARTTQPRIVRCGVVVFAGFTGLTIGLSNFLDTALSFAGVWAKLYAALLAATLVFLSLSLAVRLLMGDGSPALQAVQKRAHKRLLLLAMAALGAMALVLPAAVGQWDWNGVLQRTFALSLWCALGTGFCMLQRRQHAYTVPAIIAVLLLSASGYKAMQMTEIFWARPLGATEDDIGRCMEQYASQNFSFQLAHHLLGNAPQEEPCGDLCRILRQYTNIRDAETSAVVRLADPLRPATGERPNVFILVIDSMRPDFLGAYNPKVDFTPNIDSFARDSVVFRNAYTQYAGTTLSEPAIWSGAMLLHAHYVRPFQNVNSLERLMTIDGYQMVVSFDTVLKELLSPADDLIKLDTDLPVWNQFELCSTIQQLTRTLDARPDKTRPVFFYAQPMNVHMFAHNHLQAFGPQSRVHPGFNARIASEVSQVDECMGKFLSYVKAQGLYDESIIILASDHGDATGEFGRQTHSTIIYPEVMRVPLIVHLPKSMQGRFVNDRDRVSTLTDITPSLYYLLGHKPVKQNAMFGHPLFVETRQEIEGYGRDELFLASDEAAVYGLLEENGRYIYATYDSPARSFLFDLARDPNAEHNILTPEVKRQYDQRVIDYLEMIAGFYGYKPGITRLLSSR
jgi:Sulfatase